MWPKALSAIAISFPIWRKPLSKPKDIENMFIDHGHGIYTCAHNTTRGPRETLLIMSLLTASCPPTRMASSSMPTPTLAAIPPTSTTPTMSSGSLSPKRLTPRLAAEGWSCAGWAASVNAYNSINIGDNRIAGQQITGSLCAIWVTSWTIAVPRPTPPSMRWPQLSRKETCLRWTPMTRRPSGPGR